MNRQILSDVEDKDIAELYASAYKNLHAPQELYRKVMNMDQENKKVTKIGRGLPKAASVAIILVCVLALSGGVVWAMTASPLKDFFFKNSDKEFAEMYNEAGIEYEFGTHKLIYEGSLFDNATRKGTLHFTVWDKDDNPVDLEKENRRKSEGEGVFTGIKSDDLIFRFVFPEILVDIGNDEQSDRCCILLMYLQQSIKRFDGNNVYIQFDQLKRNNSDYFSEKDCRFVLLNEEDLEKIKKEIEGLDTENIVNSIKETQDIMKVLSEDGTMQPEMVEILKKYMVCTAESSNAQPQIIQLENLRITVGRASLKIDFNEDCNLDEFIFIRDDGTRAVFRKTSYIDRDNEKIYKWYLESENPKDMFSGSRIGRRLNGDYKITEIFNFGFVLGADEKVKIEANGKIYE